jgi:hypothetical protein
METKLTEWVCTSTAADLTGYSRDWLRRQVRLGNLDAKENPEYVKHGHPRPAGCYRWLVRPGDILEKFGEKTGKRGKCQMAKLIDPEGKLAEQEARAAVAEAEGRFRKMGIHDLLYDGGPPPDMEDLLELLDNADQKQFECSWVALIIDWAADSPVGLGPLAYVLSRVRDRYKEHAADSSSATRTTPGPATGAGRGGKVQRAGVRKTVGEDHPRGRTGT